MTENEVRNIELSKRPEYCFADRKTAYSDGSGPKVGDVVQIKVPPGHIRPYGLRDGVRLRITRFLLDSSDFSLVQIGARGFGKKAKEVWLTDPFTYEPEASHAD